MAKQTSLITFTGKLGNMIGYYRHGQYCLRSMPDIVRQTQATQRAAQRFGIASRKGALIRRAFRGILHIPSDNSYINQLTKALIHAGNNDLNRIEGFRFNQQTGIDKFFSVAPLLTEEGILHIPAQWLGQYKNFTALEVKVIATRISFTKHQVISTDVSQVTIDTGTFFTGADLLIDAPGKGTLIVALQVRALSDGQPTCNKQFIAADIIAVSAHLPKRTIHPPAYAHPAVSRTTPGDMIYAMPATTLRHIIQRE